MSDLLIAAVAVAAVMMTGFFGVYAVVGHVIAGQQVRDLHGHRLRAPLTVSVSEHIKEGQIIGNVWSTGASSGSHRRFRIFLGGTRLVDPFVYLKARVGS
jgi:murein DD-endopeptidase MepM/ murein hydrolase activator NlpD